MSAEPANAEVVPRHRLDDSSGAVGDDSKYAAGVDAAVDRTAVADAVRSCPTLRRAQLLAAWVGNGTPVIAKRVLRLVDVPRAGGVLEIGVANRVRTAADLPELHRPWIAMLEIGLISIDGDKALPGPAVASWSDISDQEMPDH